MKKMHAIGKLNKYERSLIANLERDNFPKFNFHHLLKWQILLRRSKRERNEEYADSTEKCKNIQNIRFASIYMWDGWRAGTTTPYHNHIQQVAAKFESRTKFKLLFTSLNYSCIYGKWHLWGHRNENKRRNHTIRQKFTSIFLLVPLICYPMRMHGI